ncbi:tandem-95 repeat protein, partial [Halodesulfovibrio sp. MK-HDV]|uniref:tandem-95 repeat protein n=1 Tax=Halodesulfovibrio sp. MK-HDV TaxID=2599925 RepID=UPI001370612C
MADNTSKTNITLATPEDGVTHIVEITSGTQLTFDFDPKLVEYELTEDGDLLLTFKNGGGYTFKGFAEIEGDINVSVDGYVVSMSGLLLDIADIDTASGESKSLTSGQQGFEEGFGDTLGGIDNLTLQSETLTDASGNVSSDIPDMTVDVTPPDIDPIDLTTPSDSGTFNDDNLTNVANPVFAGSAEAFSTVTLFADGVLLGTTTTNSNGNWEFESPTLDDGVYDITATATDANGNTSDPTPPLSVEIDLTTPATPDITFTDNQDGISTYINAEEVTGDGTPTTTVNVLVPDSARTGDTLVITYNDINGAEQAVSTVLTNAQVLEGVNIEVAAIGEFELNITAQAFDPAGNEGDTTTSSILIDTILPDAPVIDLQVDSRFDDDDYTNNGLLTFTGEADSVLQFTVVDDMGNNIATPPQTSMVNGTFTFDMDSLPDGTYTVVATLTDAAGNTSAPQKFSYTLDQTNPDLVTINESLPEISEDVPFDPSLGLFVEQLQASEPNVTYEIVDGNDNNWFTLTPDGELSVTEEGINAGVMNFEQTGLGDGRTINIQTTDQAGNTNTNDYTLEVTNVNERPDAVDFSYADTIEANAGLQGNFYAFDNQTDLPPGINWTHKDAFDYVEAHISNSATPTDAAFIAEQLDFGFRSGTLDTFNELSDFISGSGTDLVDTRPDDNFDTYADRGIIKFEGSAFFEDGEHRIRVYSDDGFQLKIDGEVVASFYNDRAPGTTTVNIGDLTEGFHDIEIIYWDQGGRYVLKIEDSVRPEGGAWSNFEVLGNDPSTLVHNPLVTAEDNSLTVDADLLVNQATDPDQNTTLSLVEDSLELQVTVNGVAVIGVDILPPVTENGVTYTNEISGVGQIGTDTNGNIVFTPTENYNGEVSFTYEIQDDGTPQLISDPATVTLNVTPVNDAPTAIDTTSYDEGIEDQALVIARADLLEDLDIQDVEDGQNVILDIASTNSDILSITYNQNTEEFTIIPKENFNGDTQLRVSIEDQDGATTYRAINANFDPVNDIPTADLTTNFNTGVEDQTLYITRADIISSLNIADVEDGQNVILDLTTANPNIQNISYDAVSEQYVIEPVENFNGDVQFNLSITDQEGASIQRTIGANFDPVNDVPTADLTTNFDTGVEDQTLYITRADIISSLNITDVEDGQNVILDLTTANPNIQNISYDAVNEQYVIEPVENFNGDVQFNLAITDQEGTSIQRTIGANFDPVNDVPTADLTTNFDTGVEDQTLYITRADIISSLNIADVEDVQNVILDLTTANPNIQNISYDAVNEQYVIEPVENFNGDVQFNLSITDQEGASIQRTIGANFDPVNDIPTADLTTNFDTGVEDQTLYITRADIISSLNIDDVEDGQNVILDLTTANPNIQNISYDAVSEQYVIEPV